MSEIENLLNELRNMKNESSNNITNSSEMWALIKKGDWQVAGFESEEKMKQWIVENPYSNIA